MSMQKEKSSQQEIAEIWKLFRETRKQIQLMSDETNRQMKDTDERMKETDERMKDTDERMKETDERMKDAGERLKETERILKEGAKETREQMKETDRRLRKLDYLFTGHWGKLMEALTAGGLKTALQERDIQVTGVCSNAERIYKDERREFDVIATNGEELVVVEVKTTLKLEQVQYFLESIRDFKNYFPEYRDKKVYGAMAYLKSNEGASQYAEKKGLFILNPVGNIIKVVNSVHFRPVQID